MYPYAAPGRSSARSSWLMPRSVPPYSAAEPIWMNLALFAEQFIDESSAWTATTLPRVSSRMSPWVAAAAFTITVGLYMLSSVSSA